MAMRRLRDVSQPALNYYQLQVGWCRWRGCSTPRGPSAHIHNYMRVVQRQPHTHHYLISDCSPRANNWEKGPDCTVQQDWHGSQRFGTGFDKWASGAGSYANVPLFLTLPVTVWGRGVGGWGCQGKTVEEVTGKHWQSTHASDHGSFPRPAKC